MKKLINSPDTLVTDALAGLAAAHSSLAVDLENRVITRSGGPSEGKVGLVSGGGSGHEPLHGGFVGYGMLDAACAGEVFTSPVPDQMLVATKAVNGGAGVLHLVKNYTGDVLNFQMAAELAEDEGIEVVSVVINDDVAVQDSLYTAGRRGTGATVFVEKIAGALAERGAALAEVAAVAAEVNERSRSFGVALTSCTVPAAGKPNSRNARSSWASASMASPAGRGPPSPRPARSRRPPWTRLAPTCRWRVTFSSWSMAWAGPR
jgi:dihydroxyacetone kinase-like protein